MNKEQFIEKVKKQHYYIDFLDALILTSLFTEEFGVIHTKLTLEQEFTFMFYKLLGLKARAYQFEPMQVCQKCKKLLMARSFYVVGKKRRSICKVCEPKNFNK